MLKYLILDDKNTKGLKNSCIASFCFAKVYRRSTNLIVAPRKFIMANFISMYRQLLSLPLSALVKNNPIPANPIEALSLNIHQPIVYVLPYTSQTDFVVFRRNCSVRLARSRREK